MVYHELTFTVSRGHCEDKRTKSKLSFTQDSLKEDLLIIIWGKLINSETEMNKVGLILFLLLLVMTKYYNYQKYDL